MPAAIRKCFGVPHSCSAHPSTPMEAGPMRIQLLKRPAVQGLTTQAWPCRIFHTCSAEQDHHHLQRTTHTRRTWAAQVLVWHEAYRAEVVLASEGLRQTNADACFNLAQMYESGYGSSATCRLLLRTTSVRQTTRNDLMQAQLAALQRCCTQGRRREVTKCSASCVAEKNRAKPKHGAWPMQCTITRRLQSWAAVMLRTPLVS